MPLDEPVLKCLASLNPVSIGGSTHHKYMKRLGDFFPQLLDTDIVRGFSEICWVYST